jgi:N-acetylmuramoyl-L-alanine amidase
MMISILKKAIIIALFFIFLLPFQVLAQGKILNIRYWAAPDHTRVVIDASDDIPHTVDNADRKVTIHFKNAVLSESIPREILLNKPGIDKIQVTDLHEGGVKVELSVAEHVEAKLFKLSKFEDKPDRVVIDLELPEIEKQETQEREQVKVSGKKNNIIVIDPGHGGEDPGAIGRRGTYEKRVVLEIGKKLKGILNKKEGYRAFLTRDGDYYVPFKKRLKIAREYGADLFISVHADAFRRRSANGSSVYCLSIGGASSEAAKLLARQENLADIVGGSSNGESSDESDPIILNMFQTNTINTSKIFGRNLLKHLGGVGHVKYSRVQEAPFRVLKLPEIPSILVETAFISNLKEEQLLRTDRYQMVIAKAIAASVTEFLPVQPSSTPDTFVTRKGDKTETVAPDDAGKKENNISDSRPALQQDAVKITQYKVKRGDSLDKIAKRHSITISALLKLNNMKLKDPLLIGKKLNVPEQEKEILTVPEKAKPATAAVKTKARPDSKRSILTYKVKDGDTLDKIAKKHNTTLGSLLKLNHMKMKDPLYAGKTVKIMDTRAGGGDAEKKRTASKPGAVSYRVRNGDTLDKLARKYNTSIQELRRLNHMKRTDTLYVDQKLKLPQNSS